MNNEKDWKKLEEWAEGKEAENIKKYKIDIKNINVEKKSGRITKFSKILKMFGKISTLAIGIFIISICIIAFNPLFLEFKNLQLSVDANIEDISRQYGITTEIIYKDINDKGNGKYIFALKDNREIQFTVIKNYGELKYDFLDNIHKYYFDNWESLEKQNFIIKEEIDHDEMLDYSTYIKINGYNEVESASRKICEFANFCGAAFYQAWSIYIEKDDIRIYFNNYNKENLEENIEYAKKEYLTQIKQNYINRGRKLNEEIPNEEFSKYSI